MALPKGTEMSLIEDISADLVNEKASLSNTLRKAKVLAQELGVPEFRNWVRSELEGCMIPKDIPKYRKFRPTNYGTFSVPFGSGARNVVLPTLNLENPVKEYAENVIFGQGIGELEGMLQLADNNFQRRWPQEALILARDSVKICLGKWFWLMPINPYQSTGLSGLSIVSRTNCRTLTRIESVGGF